MSTTYLKIKIKSLADEARTIRAEEAKATGSVRANLHSHRVIDVRREQRAALLAYAYLRGRTYRSVEPCPRCDRKPFDRAGPIWERVRDMIVKYGPEGALTKPQAWEVVVAWRKEPVVRAKAA